MSLKSELRKWPQLLGAILVVPIYFLPSLVLAALRIRFVRISAPNLMGHLAIEPDCYLRDMRLGRVPFAHPVLLARHSVAPANPRLLDYWRDHFSVVENPLLFRLLQPFRHFPWVYSRIGRYANTPRRTAGAYATYAAWGDRPPILTLKPEDETRGNAVLRQLGVPEGAWFVCFHSRESPDSSDSNAQGYRNSAIADYRLAVAEVVRRGGWCIRVGSAAVETLEPMERVIDYPHSGLRSDWMDIFLCARCRFFVGNSSGLFLLATIFGTPVALANMAPVATAYAFTSADLAIPKIIRDETGKVLGFDEVMARPVGNFRDNEDFVRTRYSVVNNTPEEICEMVIEMIERLEHTATYGPQDDRLQENFRNLLQPRHYSYGATSRIGRDYLRHHADLMGTDEPAA